jgi:hypothetical protein
MNPYKMNPACGCGGYGGGCGCSSRSNPVSALENPSGLLIGGLVAALAAAGGAAWWFTRPKAGGGIDLPELDQSLVAQLSAEQKQQIRDYNPNMAGMVAAAKGTSVKDEMTAAKNRAMQRMLRPSVLEYDATGQLKESRTVSPAEAQALVDAGSHAWNVGYPPKTSVAATKKPAPKKGKK